jgi:5-methylcytosine-specific restriction enzyme subunit McrC
MGIKLSEHKKFKISKLIDGVEFLDNKALHLHLNADSFALLDGITNKAFNDNSNCYTVENGTDFYQIKAEYCIGLDWLGNSGRYIQVEPKINIANGENFELCLNADAESEHFEKAFSEDSNTEISRELDYLKMLMDVMAFSVSAKEVKGLVNIDWSASKINIDSKDDKLTPFLIIQFLQLLKAIVKKGLKKSYYKIQENLSSKIKGKILVGQHVKKNVLKNRFTNIFCEYQVFGEDNYENRFLNKAFVFVCSYVNNHKAYFFSNACDIEQIIDYCRPSLEHIGTSVDLHQLKNIKTNPFFKEYKDCIKIGEQILKRFAYNISQTADQKIATPPFWIDMPRLFELYIYEKMLKANEGRATKIKYQFSTYGNALDILIKQGKYSMVIDAKYKLHYKHGEVHADMRQVAGYARLNKVLNELAYNNEDFVRDAVLPCLIIYPDIKNGIDLEKKLIEFNIENLINPDRRIKAYSEIYKLGVKLPLIFE